MNYVIIIIEFIFFNVIIIINLIFLYCHCVFFKNSDAKLLLLKYKSSRDINHSINKTEMRRLAYRLAHQENSDVQQSNDTENRQKYPSTSISIGWEGLGVIFNMDVSCLRKACLLHNPNLYPAVDPAIALCAITKMDISRNSFEVNLFNNKLLRFFIMLNCPCCLLVSYSMILLNLSKLKHYA